MYYCKIVIECDERVDIEDNQATEYISSDEYNEVIDDKDKNY